VKDVTILVDDAKVREPVGYDRACRESCPQSLQLKEVGGVDDVNQVNSECWLSQ
jgi:hypothetical protein